MSKNKYFVITGSTVLLLSLAGIGWQFWPDPDKANLAKRPGASKGTYAEPTLSLSDGSNSIPLTPKPSTSKTDGGLHVESNTEGNNLGQLTPNSAGQNNPGSSQPATPTAPDPATFGQYDEYKNGSSALFGDIQAGTGPELTAGKKAAVYYKGWLTNGQLFDMSRTDAQRKLEPFVFTMGQQQVIPGWEQGLFGMKVGGTRLIIVPPAVGYGATGQGSIPPNAVLVFMVQLQAVE